MSKSPRGGVDRRRLLSLGGTAIAASSLAAPVAVGATAKAGAATRQVTVTEGTNIAVSAAPDGKTLAFDLYGVIWTLPVTGGAARRRVAGESSHCQGQRFRHHQSAAQQLDSGRSLAELSHPTRDEWDFHPHSCGFRGIVFAR